MLLEQKIVACSHMILFICLDALFRIVNIDIMFLKFLQNLNIDWGRVESYYGTRQFGKCWCLDVEPRMSLDLWNCDSLFRVSCQDSLYQILSLHRNEVRHFKVS